MQFLDRPIDLDALRTVLIGFTTGPERPETDLLVAELLVLVEEAQRSFERYEWEERILDRWSAFEEALRAAGPRAPSGGRPG